MTNQSNGSMGRSPYNTSIEDLSLDSSTYVKNLRAVTCVCYSLLQDQGEKEVSLGLWAARFTLGSVRYPFLKEQVQDDKAGYLMSSSGFCWYTHTGPCKYRDNIKSPIHRQTKHREYKFIPLRSCFKNKRQRSPRRVGQIEWTTVS